MFRQVIGPIISTVKEKLVDPGFEVVRGKFNSMSDSKNLERNFKSLVARADNFKKEISIQVQQEGRKRKRKRKGEDVRVWFQEVKKVRREYHTFKKEEKRKGFLKKIFGGKQAIQLNTRICDLDDQSRQFGELVVGDRHFGELVVGNDSSIAELEGKAFKDSFERISNFLVSDKVSSIGVYGMGGVGKSTLVEHVYNQIRENNECVFWVTVSQGCNIKMLQDKIARTLDLDLSCEDDDEGARAGRLNHTLSQRNKFVLILDDVWERIDLVKVGVPLSIKGCKWMMTSPSLRVCQEMNCQIRIVVKPLHGDEGWNLFLKNLGEDTAVALEDPQVKGNAMHMVDICNGFPLAIITLAGAMSGATDIQEWRHALGVLEESAIGYEWMEEMVFRVLKYSFDRLSPNDQRCFLYCSLYPKDWRIPREELCNKFISEELVDKTKSRASQRDEGHSALTRIVKASLLESDSDPFNGECVKMHDLVRAMALMIIESKTVVIGWLYHQEEIQIEEQWRKDVEKVSLISNSIEKIPDGISPNCPKLSTLLLQHNPLREGIATSFFSQMCGLRTLDLSGTQIVELPDSVSNLVDLRSLLLGRCNKLRKVPCVRKLKELRELDLSGTSIEEAPEGLEELLNIRCLLMSGVIKLLSTSLVLKAPWIQVLRLPYTMQAELVEGGSRLEVFEGWLKDMTDFRKLVASKKDGISYRIVVSDSTDMFAYYGDHDGKNRLIISKYDLNEGDLTVSAEFIHHLEINFCRGLSNCLLDDLSNPTSLNSLRIIYSAGIQCILTYDQLKAPQSRFEALEEIELVDLQDFKGLIYPHEVETEAAFPPLAFSSLTKLSISRCNKMRKLGLPLCAYEKLEYISIQDCEEVEEIIQLASAYDDTLPISLPNLKYLSLVRLPCLETFCESPVICNSTEAFELKYCPRLEGTQDSYKPFFEGTTTSSTTKKVWWEIDLFRHWSR